MARSGTCRFLMRIGLMVAVSFAVHPGFAQDQLVRSFRIGADTASVGVIEASPDTEIEGPQALYSGEEGEIYLLDQVNSRVLRFDPRKSTGLTRSLTLPDDIRPTDLVVVKDTIYVWDGEPRALQPVGSDDAPTRSLAITRSLSAVDEAILSTFAQMGSATTEAAPGATNEAETDEEATRSLSSLNSGKALGRSRQIIASHGRGRIIADIAPVKTSGVLITLRTNGGESLGKLKMQVRSRIGSVEVLDIDRSGRVFVLGENIPVNMTGGPSVFVARYAATGALEGVYELPLDRQIGLSRRFVTVSPEGEVYFLRTRKGSADLLGVGFQRLKDGQVIDLEPSDPSTSFGLSEFARRKGASAAVRPLDRAQVVQTAMQFANARWHVSSGAYGRDPDAACNGFARVRRPGYLHDKLGQEVIGIPYCWGCHGSLSRIAIALTAGQLAGNVCTRNDPRSDVVGVDCSAFVSASWGLATHFTTLAIPSITRELSNPFDLLPGDALNKAGSHVMLFLRFTPDRRIEIVESSTGGCNGRVCRNIYPLGSLLARGYRPVRFRGLLNDMSAPVPVAAALSGAPNGQTQEAETSAAPKIAKQLHRR